MEHPELPRLMSVGELCDYLEISDDTAARWIREGYGPPAIKIGQRTVYPLTGVIKFIDDQMNGSKAATPAQIQAAMVQGRAGVREAMAERTAAMQQLDRENGSANPYEVTVSDVGGSTPGIEKLTYQNGQWVKNGTLVQPVVESAAAPHLLNCR